ncbi:hypothetical protein PINS_up001817 [Pythium insidiosum]|nr:hypothetical protein PINS_up001817 [Pythium insidiosum]
MARTATAAQGQRGPALSVRNAANPLAPFFSVLPADYLSYSDVRDLGSFSYNYEMTGLLADMFTTCGGSGVAAGFTGVGARRLQEKTTERPLVEAVIVPSNSSLSRPESWFQEALAAARNATADADWSTALHEVEKMTCLFYDECRGPVVDYSDMFRASFQVSGSTPCRQIVDDVRAGRDRVAVDHWKELMQRHLPC